MVYGTQKFELAPDAEVTPTFTDTVDVPPGRSFVQLWLYHFPRNFDPALYGDERMTDGMASTQQSAPVESL